MCAPIHGAGAYRRRSPCVHSLDGIVLARASQDEKDNQRVADAWRLAVHPRQVARTAAGHLLRHPNVFNVMFPWTGAFSVIVFRLRWHDQRAQRADRLLKGPGIEISSCPRSSPLAAIATDRPAAPLVQCSRRPTARNIASAISSFPTGVTCASSIQMRESWPSKIDDRE